MADDRSPGPRFSRTDLLAPLADVFETMGYDGATLARLAAATGLSKASLYHHFPGGKAEMAAALLRAAVAELEGAAFSRLTSTRKAPERLAAFIEGFDHYAQHGERSCLLSVFAAGSAGAEHGAGIADQFADWSHRLAATFEEAGYKPKRAERAAADLLAGLYGALQLARLRQDPDVFRRQVKRLRKRLPR
ncbi:MAG TPA: TetR/AcrR family transcriptional regulator [Pseudomonadales bacterium]